MELNTINKPKSAISNISILDFLIFVLFLPLMIMTNLFDINCIKNIKKITLKENVQKYTGRSNYNLLSQPFRNVKLVKEINTYVYMLLCVRPNNTKMCVHRNNNEHVPKSVVICHRRFSVSCIKLGGGFQSKKYMVSLTNMSTVLLFFLS